MKLWIKRRIMRRATDLERLERARARALARRRRAGTPPRLQYFHRFGDPASALMPPLLLRLAEHYAVQIDTALVGPPGAAVAPEPQRLEAYARADAARLAQRFGLPFSDPGTAPEVAQLDAAAALGAAALASPDALARIARIDESLWSAAPLPPGPQGDAAAACAAGTAARDRLGHFQSAAVHYEGEWYWGADRLHYLEARLEQEGARTAGSGFLAEPLLESAACGEARGAVVEVYPSLRSPYTWLAIERIHALARRWQARVALRPVLPMVMRKLPVPRRKGLYFLADCAREAQRLGIAFGDIADPVGRPTERGLAVLMAALDAGRGEAFVTAFLRAAWSEGVDAGTDRGLRRICAAAGIDWADARAALADPGWRERVEANREQLAALGLWGVPSFRVGDLSVWGQDRLWLVEAELERLAREAQE